MATKELWYLPKGGPGRPYLLHIERVLAAGAGLAVDLKMFRRLAAGEVTAKPVFHVVLALTPSAVGICEREHGADDAGLEDFLMATAEKAAACLDQRLPPPIEPAVAMGHVVWLLPEAYASERALTMALLQELG